MGNIICKKPNGRAGNVCRILHVRERKKRKQLFKPLIFLWHTDALQCFLAWCPLLNSVSFTVLLFVTLSYSLTCGFKLLFNNLIQLWFPICFVFAEISEKFIFWLSIASSTSCATLEWYFAVITISLKMPVPSQLQLLSRKSSLALNFLNAHKQRHSIRVKEKRTNPLKFLCFVLQNLKRNKTLQTYLYFTQRLNSELITRNWVYSKFPRTTSWRKWAEESQSGATKCYEVCFTESLSGTTPLCQLNYLWKLHLFLINSTSIQCSFWASLFLSPHLHCTLAKLRFLMLNKQASSLVSNSWLSLLA